MLREMNPLVDVQAQAGPPAGSGLEREAHGLVLDLTGDPASVSASSVACRAAGLPFFAGGSRGTIGWAFADLGEHRFVVERRGPGPDGAKQAEACSTSYPSWARAMAADVGGRSLKRVHPVYLMLRGEATECRGGGVVEGQCRPGGVGRGWRRLAGMPAGRLTRAPDATRLQPRRSARAGLAREQAPPLPTPSRDWTRSWGGPAACRQRPWKA